MPKPTKELIHDEKIAPLIEQVMALCKEHRIPVVMSFGLTPTMLCTSMLLEPEDHDVLHQVAHVLVGHIDLPPAMPTAP